MMTFKELKKLVKLPLYKEQRVPTVKALEESGVSVVAEKILENHGSISVYQNGYVIYRAHKRVTVFSLRNCVHYKYDASAQVQKPRAAESFLRITAARFACDNDTDRKRIRLWCKGVQSSAPSARYPVPGQ